ncbi:MAG TPA: formate dehydrogenase subunit delta [Burkholderiaceae bacterium]|nr:formate dehydrogenase subunit delta [Burkholderiaceae bacterium]
MKNIAHLIQLANRISYFFDAFPNRQEAIDGVADHIRNFWDPRMRRALLQYLEEHPSGEADGNRLTPLALEALQQNHERLMPQEAPH